MKTTKIRFDLSHSAKLIDVDIDDFKARLDEFLSSEWARMVLYGLEPINKEQEVKKINGVSWLQPRNDVTFYQRTNRELVEGQGAFEYTYTEKESKESVAKIGAKRYQRNRIEVYAYGNSERAKGFISWFATALLFDWSVPLPSWIPKVEDDLYEKSNVSTNLFQLGRPDAQIRRLRRSPKSFVEYLEQYPKPAKIVIGASSTAKEFDFRFDVSEIKQGKNPATIRFYLDRTHFASIEIDDWGTGIVNLAWATDKNIVYAEMVFNRIVLPLIEPCLESEPANARQTEQNAEPHQQNEQERDESKILKPSSKDRSKDLLQRVKLSIADWLIKAGDSQTDACLQIGVSDPKTYRAYRDSGLLFGEPQLGTTFEELWSMYEGNTLPQWVRKNAGKWRENSNS